MQSAVDSGVSQNGFFFFCFCLFFYDTTLPRHGAALTHGLAKLVLHGIQATA